jgi:hypothetical protein
MPAKTRKESNEEEGPAAPDRHQARADEHEGLQGDPEGVHDPVETESPRSGEVVMATA